MAISTPVVLGYGLYSGIHIGNYVDAFFNLSIGVLFLIVAILLKTTSARMSLYRITIAGLTVLLVYSVGFGLYGDSESLWLLIYPLVVFFLFGTREGLVWIALVMFPSAIVLYFPGPFNANEYTAEFRFALPIAVVLSVMFSYLLESLRAHFYDQLETQSIALRKALADVKELNGLLPICASCKRIRNDEGYWQTVEQYIGAQTNARFSHGICNNCLKRDEPEVYEELLSKGKIKPVDD